MAKAIKLNKKDLTKTVLEVVAKELNKILLALNPENDPIVTGKDTTVAKLNEEIADVAGNLLTTKDKLTGKTSAVIVAMGVTIPEPEGGEDADGEINGEITTEQLETAVADINKVLELDPAIPNEDPDQMKADILEVANDNKGIKPSDDLTAETRDLITALQAEFDSVPGAEEADPDATDADADAAAKAAAKLEADAKKKADAAAKKAEAAAKKKAAADKKKADAGGKEKKVTRIDAVIDAMRNGASTADSIIEKADSICVENGAASNQSGVKQYVSIILKALALTGAITIDGKDIKVNF